MPTFLEYNEEAENKGPQIVKIDESGNKSILFNYDEYFANRAGSNNNVEEELPLWVYTLMGGMIFLAIYFLSNRKKIGQKVS